MSIHLIGILLGAILLVGSGCMSGPQVVPEVFKANIDSTVTFPKVLEEPTLYQRTMVLLGGEVLTAKRLKEGTRLEILQLPLDGSEEPVLERAASQGRFFAFESSFLDSATLPPNTSVTLLAVIPFVTRANFAALA